MSIVILVALGAEYRSVQRGLRHSGAHTLADVQILAMPAGTAVRDFLETLAWDWSGVQQVLVMGLCGGLSSTAKPGQVGYYQFCQTEVGEPIDCADLRLSIGLEISLDTIPGIARWRGLTIDRVVTKSQEKQALHTQTQCDVVDMESAWIMAFMEERRIETVVLRVVSDGVMGDLPNLSQAFDAAGKLQPWELVRVFVHQPIAALRLIRGSLIALWRLEDCTAMLWASFTV